MVFQVDGLAYTPASTSSFLTQTYCILVPMYHAVVGRRFPRPVQLLATAGVLAGIAILVVFCTLLAFNLMNRCQKYIPASEAALIYTLEPVSTSFFATFLPLALSRLVGINYENEQLSINLLIGGGLILAANLVMQIWGHTPVAHAGETPAPTTRLDRAV